MGIMLIILIPYLILAAAFFFSLRSLFRSHAPSRILFLPSLGVSALLTLGLLAWGFVEIGNSTSSTSAIGYLVLPYMALAGAVISFLVALAVSVILRFMAETNGWATPRLTSVPKLICALLFLSIVSWAVQHNLARSRLLDSAMSESTNEVTLESLLHTAVETQDIELASQLAQNPSLSVPDLTQLFENCKDTLSDPFSPDYRLFHSLAWNPHTPAGILTVLADSPFESVRYALASNPSTPAHVLEGLMDEEDSLIRYSLAENPNLPEPLRQQLREQEIQDAASSPAQVP